MHVFIDTNILLNFYHFTADELDALNDVFASHEHGSASVHLTEQVCDEFKRNRENRIKDALKRFKGNKYTAQLPSFMKAYEEFAEIKKLTIELQKQQKSILAKADEDITAKNLIADGLIGEIIEKSEVIETTDEYYQLALKRVTIGNPPGKNKSVGDAINWVILLNSVPNGENLHIISEDGDFYSSLNDSLPDPFLSDEWSSKKNSSLHVYRTLSGFMKEHFDGVAFSFDTDKEALIDGLSEAGGFSTTHSLIEKLEGYSYFSLKEVQKILDAAHENNQFGWIVTDGDVSDFLKRVVIPHIANITSEEHKKIMEPILEEEEDSDDDF